MIQYDLLSLIVPYVPPAYHPLLRLSCRYCSDSITTKDYTLLGEAIKKGDRPLIEWLFDHGITHRQACLIAIDHYRIKLAQWLYLEKRCVWDSNCTHGVIHWGDLHAFIWALNMIISSPRAQYEWFMSAMIDRGHLEMLQWFHARESGVLSYSHLSVAIDKRKRAIVVWILGERPYYLNQAMGNTHYVMCLHMWDLLPSDPCRACILSNNISGLRYLVGRHYPWDPQGQYRLTTMSNTMRRYIQDHQDGIIPAEEYYSESDSDSD